RCLHAIEGPSGAAIPGAAARVLAARKAPGTAAALLAYLPFTDDAGVAGEVSAALWAVALLGGKADPAVVSALKDPVPVRRAVAAESLCRKELPEQLPGVRALLKD